MGSVGVDRAGESEVSREALGRLAGDFGNQIEVLVHMQDSETGKLGDGGDQEVGNLRGPVLTPLGEHALHLQRPAVHVY